MAKHAKGRKGFKNERSIGIYAKRADEDGRKYIARKTRDALWYAAQDVGTYYV